VSVVVTVAASHGAPSRVMAGPLREIVADSPPPIETVAESVGAS
jgi:hypothetical protein